MLQHLFLSPHFDDAVGSCGSTITRLRGIGHAARILTVFGGLEREPFSLPARVLHSTWKLDRPVGHRRLEDESACRVLECESSFLEFPDAIYRQDADDRHLYPTFESLRESLAPEDHVLAELLAAEVSGHLSDKNTILYCPLAIGAHVDHVLVRDCGRSLAAQDSTVVFYKDFYYDRQWNGKADDSAMTRVNVTPTLAELGRKLAAFSEYRSQIPDLFENRAGMTSYFTGTGKDESLFLPRQADTSHLAMLLSVLTRKSA